MLQDIEKIKSEGLVLGILSILLFISPGAGFLYLFDRGLFFTLDIWKIILLSSSISIPLITINTLRFYMVFTKHNNFEKDTFFFAFFFSALISSYTLYIVLLSSYVFSFEEAKSITLIFILELAFVFLARFLFPKK